MTSCGGAKVVRQPTADATTSGEEPRSGVVRYSLDGSAESVAKRRQESEQLMSDVCGGSYRIIAEEDEKVWVYVHPVTTVPKMTRDVEFECSDPD